MKKLITAAVALGALTLAFAGTAAAQPAATPVVDHRDVQAVGGVGLTLPSSVVETPDGTVWVSDELYGVCRVSATGLVETEFCAPEPLEPPDGALVPVADPTRPTVARQIAFDAVTGNFYVAEGSSGGSGVWRMHWNADTHEIDTAIKIYDSTAGDDRVFGLALTETGDVVFSSKRTTNIRRLSAPATISSPLTAGQVTTIGFSFNAEATSLAVLDGVVYLADGGLLTRIAGASGTAAAVPGQAASTTITALAADPAHHRLYAGTGNQNLVDSVLSFTSAAGFGQATYVDGYTNVTGLGVGPHGDLYIAEDPNSALTPSVESIGVADLYSRPFGSAELPDVMFTAQPQVVTNEGPWAFAFEAVANRSAGTRFQCSLDDAEPTDCSDGSAKGSVTFAGLAEGVHRLKVRATNDAPEADTHEWGRTAERVFTVDTTAPVVTIDNDPADTVATGGAFRMRFSAEGEGPVTYTCALDDLGPAPCSPPKDYKLDLGEHRITVVGTDAAGNTSAPVTGHVTAVAAQADPSVPAHIPGTPPAAALAPAPVTVPSTPVAPRIDIGVPCVAVSPARAAARFSLTGRNAIVRFRAPAHARYAKFTLRRATDGRGARVVETLAYARVARAGARHTTRIVMTRGERRRVRGGQMRLAVAYGTCRTRVGQWQWITEHEHPGGDVPMTAHQLTAGPATRGRRVNRAPLVALVLSIIALAVGGVVVSFGVIERGTSEPSIPVLKGPFGVSQDIPTSFGAVAIDNVEKVNGVTAKALSGVTHGISNYVPPNKVQVQASVTLTNLLREKTAGYSPTQFRLLVGKKREPVKDVRASFRPGTLQPNASITGQVEVHRAADRLAAVDRVHRSQAREADADRPRQDRQDAGGSLRRLPRALEPVSGGTCT